MPLPAVGAILAKLATAGKAVAGKVAAGAAAKGVATGGAAAAAGGGAATGGTAATAGKAASTFGKFMAAKEVLWDLPATGHVLSDAAKGAENAREYTRSLGIPQAAQALPQDLPMGKKAPRVGPSDKSGLWQSPTAPSQRVLPSAAPPTPRAPKIPTGGPPASPGGSRPRGFFENVGERFSQWRQARAAQAAAPQQLKMPSTRIPRGADFKEKLQKAVQNLRDTDPIRRDAPGLPSIGDDVSRQDQQDRKAEAAQHGEGGIKKTAMGATLAMGLVTFPIGLHKATQGLEKWTAGIMESRRPMERLNAAIATTFAKMERQELVLTGRTAAATSGTTRVLGKELIALREEMQPMREATVQMRNLAQMVLARAARWMALVLTRLATVSAYIRILKQIDDRMKAEEIKGGSIWIDEIYKKLVAGDLDRPKNKKPGGGP